MKALDDSVITDRCTLYEDSADFLKDERFTKTEYQTSANLWKMNAPRELARQSKAKRKQAPQSETKIHRTPNNAQNTQHKLGVAFSYLERNNSNC